MKLNPLQKAAREVIRREMHEYDAMSIPAKLRYERKIADTGQTPYDLGKRMCAHNVWFHEPCSKCGRDAADAEMYQRIMLRRIKELLKEFDAS